MDSIKKTPIHTLHTWPLQVRPSHPKGNTYIHLSTLSFSSSHLDITATQRERERERELIAENEEKMRVSRERERESHGGRKRRP